MSYEAQRLKDIVIQMLIILKEMGCFSQDELRNISSMIDNKFKKQGKKVDNNAGFFD